MPGAVVVVDAEEEDVVAVVEDLLGAVAVVDVPVDDRDRLDVRRFQGRLGRDRDVVEEAEAVGLSGLGVVTARSNERVR